VGPPHLPVKADVGAEQGHTPGSIGNSNQESENSERRGPTLSGNRPDILGYIAKLAGAAELFCHGGAVVVACSEKNLREYIGALSTTSATDYHMVRVRYDLVRQGESSDNTSL